MRDLLITGGLVIDPASGLEATRDVLVRDGVIAGVEIPGTFAKIEGGDAFDARGCVVSPGLIDVHVHLREPGQTHKETIATGTAAAAAGGFTSVVAMPNTLPVNDSVARLEWMIDAARDAQVRLFAMPAATIGSTGETLTDFAALAAAGAVGFTDDGKPILDDAIMRAALLCAGRLGLPISQHAEDTRDTARVGAAPGHASGSSGIHAGVAAFRLGLRGMTVEREASIVERDLRLLREIEAKDGVRPHLHVQHVSTARALQAIRSAKAEGLHVTCEATPHHFTLTDEDVGDFDTHAKMNPPLRPESDRQALIAALIDGTVDCIATDHAPHARHEKEVEFERAPNGITGLETALGLALRVLHREHGMPVSRVLQRMTSGPAAIVQLEHAGSLGVGEWADLVVFDVGASWEFEVSRSRSRSKNTPFDGAAMLGQVKTTIVGGRMVFRG